MVDEITRCSRCTCPGRGQRRDRTKKKRREKQERKKGEREETRESSILKQNCAYDAELDKGLQKCRRSTSKLSRGVPRSARMRPQDSPEQAKAPTEDPSAADRHARRLPARGAAPLGLRMGALFGGLSVSKHACTGNVGDLPTTTAWALRRTTARRKGGNIEFSGHAFACPRQERALGTQRKPRELTADLKQGLSVVGGP